MAQIYIREQDITSNGLNPDYTDITYVPGFGDINNIDDIVNGPVLVTSLSDFHKYFGDAPQTFTEDYVYTLDNWESTAFAVDNGKMFNGTSVDKDGNLIPGDVDPGYVYASELISAGMPVYYERINQPVKEDGETIFTGASTETQVWNNVSNNTYITSVSLINSGSFTTQHVYSNTVKLFYNSTGTTYTELPKMFSVSSVDKDYLGHNVANFSVVLPVVEADYNTASEFYVKGTTTPIVPDENTIYHIDGQSNAGFYSWSSSAYSKITFGEDDAVASNLADAWLKIKYSNGSDCTFKATFVYNANDRIDASDMYQAFVGTASKESIFEKLKDTGTFRIKYLTTGGYPVFENIQRTSTGSTIVEEIMSVVAATNFEDSSGATSGRGDCIALIDHTNYPARKLQGTGSVFDVANSGTPFANLSPEQLSFGAMFTPWFSFGVQSVKGYTSCNLPASFAYLKSLYNSVKTYNSWYAVSGTVRGLVSDVIDVLTEDTLTNSIANRYQANAETGTGISINAITNIYPYGWTIWGNRTLLRADSAKHVTALGYLNLRNAVCDVKKRIYDGARRYMFEQNSDILWVNFKSYITPLLERMKTSKGLSNYKIVKNNKSVKTKLFVDIILYPIYAVETIDVTIQISDEDVQIYSE